MPPEESIDSLESYIPQPADTVGRHMVGITKNDHTRITELAAKHDTSNGRIVTALLDFFFDV